MRSLFHRVEKPQYLSTTPPTETETVEVPQEATAPVEITASISTKDKTVRQQRVKKILTPQERLAKKRRLALTTIAVSLMFGGRWYAANQQPTYPVGEGVYAPNTAPKWGEMKQPNAATFYMAASDALDLDAINKSVSGVKYGIGKLMDEPLAVQKPAVTLAQPAFALLRQGMKYPYVADYQTNYFKVNPVQTKGLERPVPNFIILREMSRLLAADASVHAAEGNHAAAIGSSLDAVRLGIDQSKGHSLIDGMIGVLIQGIGAKEGMKHVASLSAAEARAAATRLESDLAGERSLAHIITAERDAMSYETLQTLFQANSRQGFSASTDLENVVAGNFGRFALSAATLFYTKQGLVNSFAEQYDKILANVKQPYYQAVHAPKVMPSSNPIVRQWVVEDFSRAFWQTTAKATWNRMLLTQLAVQAYRGEHNGSLPSSLAVLTTGMNPYLTVAPTDPFSQSGSDLLRYNPQTGKVYSVGQNGIDDGNSGDDNVDLHKN